MGHSDIKITEHYARMADKEINGAYGRVGNKGEKEKWENTEKNQ